MFFILKMSWPACSSSDATQCLRSAGSPSLETRASSSCWRPGTDIMILKNIFAKNWRKIDVFAQTTASFYILKNAKFFAENWQKSPKIGKNRRKFWWLHWLLKERDHFQKVQICTKSFEECSGHHLCLEYRKSWVLITAWL
jgi:hypothetical protein